MNDNNRRLNRLFRMGAGTVSVRNHFNFHYLETTPCNTKVTQIVILAATIVAAYFGDLKTIKGSEDALGDVSWAIIINIIFIFISILLQLTLYARELNPFYEMFLFVMMFLTNFTLDFKCLKWSIMDFLFIVVIPWTATSLQMVRMLKAQEEVNEVPIARPNPQGFQPNGRLPQQPNGSAGLEQ